MVILRPTGKLRKVLPVSQAPEPAPDTALGDWYVNRIAIERRPLLLLVSSRALLAAVTPARDVRRLPERLGEVTAQRLGRLGIASPIVESELEAMSEVHLAKTHNRSVLGIMVDFAKMLRYALEPGFLEHADLMEAEELLWDNPCYAGKAAHEVIFPRRKASDLLRAKWAAV